MRWSAGSATSSEPLAIPMLYVTHSVAEAVALGSRLFLLERGKIVAEGPPLDVLAAARRSDDGSIPFEGVLNVFARVEGHAPSTTRPASGSTTAPS